jgi:DNA-binding PadR family transcriptional regulator
MHRHWNRGCGKPWHDIEGAMEFARRGFEEWGEFPFSGRGPGRKRRFSGSELRLVLLKLIADEPRHGYELMKALEELTDGAYAPSPGTVYPTLSLLEDEGAIAESDGKKDGKRKAFAATDAGRAELEERADEIEGLMARLTGLGGRRDRDHGDWPRLWRAMTNLGSVLRNRFRAGGLDSAAINVIVDVIDDAAKRIERM